MHKPNTPIIDGFDEKLRDEFAGRAMQAIITSAPSNPNKTAKQDMETCAQASYMMADAMLEARKAVK